jgi:hypothetical protein
MPHRTTVVELSIDPDTLFSTTLAWARLNGFSLYEKKDNRTIYAKEMWNAKAWLSIEGQGEHGKLEAWLSNPQVGPEFKGNFWVGWKMPLPSGFAIGTPMAYKKKFQTLVKLLQEKTNNQKLTASIWLDGRPQPGLNKSSWTKVLMILGVFYLLGGIISFFSGMTIRLHSTYQDVATDTITNGWISLMLAITFLVSSVAINKNKVWGIWVLIAGTLLDIVLKAAVGEPPSYLTIGFTMLMIWQLFKLKNELKTA